MLRAFGADDGGLESKDREEGDEDSENGGAGGVLRAFGADGQLQLRLLAGEAHYPIADSSSVSLAEATAKHIIRYLPG